MATPHVKISILKINNVKLGVLFFMFEYVTSSQQGNQRNHSPNKNSHPCCQLFLFLEKKSYLATSVRPTLLPLTPSYPSPSRLNTCYVNKQEIRVASLSDLEISSCFFLCFSTTIFLLNPSTATHTRVVSYINEVKHKYILCLIYLCKLRTK